MRITDGRQGKAKAHVVRSRAFQLTAEEAHATPDVVMGSFIVKGISVLVLFDSRDTRSFVSLVLSKRFVITPEEVDCPLEVEIIDNHLVRVSRVHQGCVLELFSDRHPVDLVYIPLCESKVNVGMNWLSPNEVMIDCKHQSVPIRTPSE
ncbi:uncharacterized protein LOC111897157 [Lactuca sativa]|uniref:uncharacterized protein LOC111897157 n=1 Tax=Lactuca sativa TaxID=4236 RepID=UPI000CD89CCD|nr:uncharacterized protein LOC111897157 [Lactuca sativa]